MITARGLGWRYAGRPAPALHDVDLDVAEGEWLLVAGPSGGGKSTLALAIAGLIPHEFAGIWTGELEVAGHAVPRSPRATLADTTGLVFQEPAAQLVMERVEDDVAFGLESRAWAYGAMRPRVMETLAALGIESLRVRFTGRLSGGEQQRVALAGVLAPRPRILVLDEPTSSLDAPGTTTFYALLAALRASPERPTVVLVEHRVDLAAPLVDTVLALDHTGGPLATGSPVVVFGARRDALAAEGIWAPGESRGRIERALGTRSDDESRSRGSAEAGDAAGRSVAEREAGDAVLTLDGVTYRYDRDIPPALTDVTTWIGPGERVALLGPNGSGKSTLGRLAAGILSRARGVVRLMGADPARLQPVELASRATFVFQDPAVQFLRDRVADELHAGLRMPAQHAAADELLAALDLDRPGLRDASPYTLSGGEQRRLSVATALVREPALIVLDEPTYGQDRLRYDALADLLRRRLDAGTAMLAATHDLLFVAELTARALVLDHGRLVAQGTTRALLRDGAGVAASLAGPPASMSATAP